MKHLSTALVVMVAGLAATAINPQTAEAQAVNAQPVNAQPTYSVTPVYNQSATLVTNPASVNRQSTGYGRTTITPYSSDRLNGVAGSFQVRPQKREKPLIPESLNSNTPSAPTRVDPIDFFKVPPLDGGVRVKVN